MKRLTGLALAATFAATACSSNANHAVAPAPSPSNAAVIAIGAPSPAFTATSLDGKPVGLADYKGKVLVLNFWATWCPPCRAETPDMVKAFDKLGSKDVAFLGVDTTETAPVVKSFVALHGVPYGVAIGNASTYNGFGIAFIPTTLVIDANGTVRARWTGGITPEQLASYVASARAGKNSYYVTPQQKKIDGMLAVSQFRFTGSTKAIRAEVKRAQQRLDAVSAYTAKLDAQSENPRYDAERTLEETGKLELATANAYEGTAKTKKDRVTADTMLAQADGDSNRFADAADRVRDAIALEPNNAALTGQLAEAYYRLHDYDAMAKTAQAWTKLAPSDPDAWDSLGLANQRRKDFSASVAAYGKTVALMAAAAAKHPPSADKGKAYAYAADESLDYANVYVAMGDAKNAQRVFDLARQYAAKIPATSPYKSMKSTVAQRSVEGMTGVALAHGSGTRVALTKWTGPGLPGSLASTYRYRLVTVAPAGKSVTLGTKGVPHGWVASFCQDRLCSPNTVTFTMPTEGMKTYEFQLVPPTDGAKFAPVAVGSTDSNWVTTPT